MTDEASAKVGDVVDCVFDAKGDLLTEASNVFFAIAKKIHANTSSDGLEVVMALGLTATRIMFEMSKGDDALALRATEIFVLCARKSMADMLSGSDAHQVIQ